MSQHNNTPGEDTPAEATVPDLIHGFTNLRDLQPLTLKELLASQHPAVELDGNELLHLGWRAVYVARSLGPLRSGWQLYLGDHPNKETDYPAVEKYLAMDVKGQHRYARTALALVMETEQERNWDYFTARSGRLRGEGMTHLKESCAQQSVSYEVGPSRVTWRQMANTVSKQGDGHSNLLVCIPDTMELVPSRNALINDLWQLHRSYMTTPLA